jgi:predicted transcriptional regulator
MTKHLAIFSGGLAEAVLNGRKTVDFRFSKAKIAPYLKLQKGDIVLIKNVSEPVIGQVEVDNVLYFDNLSGGQLRKIKSEYLEDSAIDQASFDNYRAGSKYFSIIFFKHPRRFICPLKTDKKGRSGWRVL